MNPISEVDLRFAFEEEIEELESHRATLVYLESLSQLGKPPTRYTMQLMDSVKIASARIIKTIVERKLKSFAQSH